MEEKFVVVETVEDKSDGVVEEPQQTQEISVSPATMMAQAYRQKGDIAGLKEILELQIQWEKNEARKAYHKAMADFKANAPEIVKDRKVAFKDVKYSHASLGNVTKTINEALSKFGLSISWTTSQANNQVSVTCKITHILGHSEECTLTAGADTSGSKNSIQAIGSAVSYLQRYTALSITGLATSDMNDDGAGTEELISPEQAAEITKQLSSAKIDPVPFCAYMKVEKIEGIKKADYQKAVNVIEVKKATKK